jgi:hypothetical protein
MMPAMFIYIEFMASPNISSPLFPRSLKMFNNSQKRSQESPMDWEWQTQGPTDPNSPFLQSKQQNLKGKLLFAAVWTITHLSYTEAFEPRPQSSFMNASSTVASPFRNPSFTTPRKPFDQDLFSEVSGAESSPADNADAEDTPDPKSSTAMTTVPSGFSNKKPIFGKYGAGFTGFSPGREQRRNRFGNAVVNKVRKRKRVDRDHAALIGTRGSDSDSEDESRSKSRGQKHAEAQSRSWLSQLLTDIESHPNVPNVLSYYAQLMLNFFFLGLTIFGVWTFWSTIRSDVDKASEEATAIVVAEMAKCARDFVDNGCAKSTRPPALEAVCDNWSLCMNRDPNSVGRAKISANTFAQIFNSFIEPISYKAMVPSSSHSLTRRC